MSNLSAQEKAVSMVMTPIKPTYRAGELPEFVVVLTNNSSTPVKLCRYRLDYRLKAAMVVRGEARGPRFEAQPFVSQKWEPLDPNDIVTLAPGQSLSHRLTFSQDPVFGFLRRAKQSPVIPASHAIKGFPAGKFSFNTALSNQVGLYIGRDGVFDHRLEGRKVPDGWPGNIDGCFLELVEATALVEFK